MAVNSAITVLKYATTQGGTYSKLSDITNYPDLGSAPSKLDSTDLTAPKYKTNIFGLQEAPDLSFEANYDDCHMLLEGLNGLSNLNDELFILACSIQGNLKDTNDDL